MVNELECRGCTEKRRDHYFHTASLNTDQGEVWLLWEDEKLVMSPFLLQNALDRLIKQRELTTEAKSGASALGDVLG